MFRNLRKTRRNIKTFRFLILAVIFIPFFSACGLNQLVYLYPVEDFRVVQQGNGLQFYHNTANSGVSGFLGYEIFYKFYSGDSVAAMAAITADRNYFYEKFISSEGVITSQGFQSLFRTDFWPPPPTSSIGPLQRPNRPFLAVGGGSDIYVITFPTLAAPVNPTDTDQPTFKIFNGPTVGNIDSPNSYFYLYRTLQPTQNNYRKSFLARTDTSRDLSVTPYVDYAYFNSGDPDLTRLSGYALGTGANLYVGICVAAYGSDVSSGFSPLYSEAVVLNYSPAYPITIQF
ncbi:MAG: hypothetical protein LBT68_08620 [Spirochaetales bacterium]|jgi:hypothetical protein|nr:hypothetical protein [Spirochaetales bacterium]